MDAHQRRIARRRILAELAEGHQPDHRLCIASGRVRIRSIWITDLQAARYGLARRIIERSARAG